MSTEELTFYTAVGCPFAQRVEIAFEEAGVHPTKYFVDLRNKPDWYLSKVNPVGKVPAIAYGGPKVTPENPSPESVKLTESLVLLEFAVDIFPDSNLSPKTPVDRARARFFIERASTIPSSVFGLVMKGEGAEAVIQDFKNVQALLPPGGGWAIGSEFSIADAAIAPFIGRADVFFGNDLGRYPVGEGLKIHKQLFESPEFARLQQYWKDISARPSFKATYDAVTLEKHARAGLSRDSK
ncbi:glutathione S-transferase [Dentipellis sp. KUC8613]|nr:glutathione S-transferase [Dentipellis sp. KUC8613]